jgi:hypothetical protein
MREKAQAGWVIKVIPFLGSDETVTQQGWGLSKVPSDSGRDAAAAKWKGRSTRLGV